MVNNRNKRIDIILDVWEVVTTSTNLFIRSNFLIEYALEDLQKDEMLYKEDLTRFIIKVSNMNKAQRKEQKLSSQGRIKKLKACWKERINTN